MSTKQKAEARARRVARERERLSLKPWEFSPSEVDDGPSPYPSGTVGFESWQKAQTQRLEIRARDSKYFDNDNEGSNGKDR